MEMNKLNYLFLDFEKEILIYKKLNNTDFEINEIGKQTQLKLNKINVSLLNIHFSLTEIFK